MNKSPYNEESIRQYLLGTLSEAETERFDELSFTDEEFVEAVNAAERELIDQYAQGQLHDSLSQQFEARYLGSDPKRERVELARAFYKSVHIAEHDPLKESARHAARPALFPFARWRWQWGLTGVAASLVLAFVALSVFVSPRGDEPTNQGLSGRNASEQNPASVESNEPLKPATPEIATTATPDAKQTVSEDRRQERSSSGNSRIASVVLSPQMRGTTNIPLVSIPANAEHLAIRLELEPNDFPAYRVVLLRTEGEISWRSQKLFAQTKEGNKSLDIPLPLQRLKSRSYVLQVYGLTESGKTEPMSDYHFRVVK